MLLLIVFDRVYHISPRLAFLMVEVHQYKAPVALLVIVVWQDHQLVAILNGRCQSIEDLICLVVIDHASESFVRDEVDLFLRVGWISLNEVEESLDRTIK
jgi:hypothetical protein